MIQTRFAPRGNILAITLFGMIFTRDKKLISERILRHELIHCRQQLEWLYIPFYILYVVEWLWYLIKYHSAYKAYMAISFEREAYVHDTDVDYLARRRAYANYHKKSF